VEEPSTTRYYHGTSALAAVCISVDGFRLLSTSLRHWGEGALGNGIYVTAVMDTASFFAELGELTDRKGSRRYVVQVRMTPGTRIMRLDGQYDVRIIDYLGREFGKELFSPRFDRAIPANKHLSRIELINLANYLWNRGGDGKRGGISAWSGLEDQGPLRRYLMRHKYDGVGCIKSDIGVVVFNPSRLLADGVFQLVRPASTAAGRHGADDLTESDPRRLATEAAESIRIAIDSVPALRTSQANGQFGEDPSLFRLIRDKLAAHLGEIPRFQACLRAFCKRHDVPIAGHPIADALEEFMSENR
jgi:hypothetical protein